MFFNLICFNIAFFISFLSLIFFFSISLSFHISSNQLPAIFTNTFALDHSVDIFHVPVVVSIFSNLSITTTAIVVKVARLGTDFTGLARDQLIAEIHFSHFNPFHWSIVFIAHGMINVSESGPSLFASFCCCTSFFSYVYDRGLVLKDPFFPVKTWREVKGCSGSISCQKLLSIFCKLRNNHPICIFFENQNFWVFLVIKVDQIHFTFRFLMLSHIGINLNDWSSFFYIQAHFRPSHKFLLNISVPGHNCTCTGTHEATRLILLLVSSFGSTDNKIAQNVPLEIVPAHLSSLCHPLQLSDCADNSKIQEFVINIINEIGGIHHFI